MRRRALRHQFLLSTTMLVGVLAGYAGRAYGQQVCTASGTEIFCDGSSTDTQVLTNLTNPTITTGANFEVDTNAGSLGNGITVTGIGQISYTDENASPISATYTALYILSFGDDGGTPGGVTINTNGALSGYEGLYVRNQATGGANITTDGTVYGTYRAIYVHNESGDLSLTTDAAVSSNGDGLYITQAGSGTAQITINGDVTTNDHDGEVAVYAKSTYGSSLTIATATGTKIYGYKTGISASANGGSISITASGSVTASDSYAITATTSGTSLHILTESSVTGSDAGIYALNTGTGATSITVNGDVSANDGDAITATTNGTSLHIRAASLVTGSNSGIYALNKGTGATSIDVYGNVYGGSSPGIVAKNGTIHDRSPTDLTIRAVGDKRIRGKSGILATNFGSGALSILAESSVEGTAQGGIVASNYNDGTNLTIDAADATGTIGILASQYGSGMAKISAHGDVTGTRQHGITAINYLGSGLKITTDSDTTVTGAYSGIYALGHQEGASLEIRASGHVIGNNSRRYYFGIDAWQYSGLDLMIVTESDVSGYWGGIRAIHQGIGDLIIESNGDVTSDNKAAISGLNYAHNLQIGIGANGSLNGDYGISATQNGSGILQISVHGDVVGTKGGAAGIEATNYSGTQLAVSTHAGSTVRGDFGIKAVSSTGELSIRADGKVYGGAYPAIFASNSGGPIDIKVGGLVTSPAGSAITATTGGTISFYVGSQAIITNSGGGSAIETSGGRTSMTLAGTLNGGGSVAAQFDQGTAFDNVVTLHPTAQIDGDVLAGPGSKDTLALGGSGAGTFFLNDIDTGTNTQQYQNFETFEVDGGQWSFSGSTTAPFTVTGGTVMGTGTFGDLSLLGGTLAPGNSIGTMTVNGAFALGGGAIYEVEVNAAGQSDKVIVKGSVNLTGATLRVLAENGNYKPETDYVVIDNDGSDAVVGRFTSVTESNLAFLKPSVVYNGGDGNDVVLTLMRHHGSHNGGGPSFCSVTKTENQCNVAKALDQFPTTNELFLDVLFQTAEGAREAFDALSGEVHATVAGTLADDSRYVRDAVLGRLMQAGHTGGGHVQTAALAAAGAQVASLDSQAMALGSKFLGEDMPAPGPDLAFWTRAYGAWGNFNGDGNAATADRDLGGFVSGMDANIGGSWRAGLATGASFSNVDVDARHSSAEVESYTLGGYLGGMAGAFALRGGGLWAWSDIETSRAVIFPGFFERQKASYDADTGQLFGEVAYPTQMMGLAVEPFGGLAYVTIDTGSFKEHGGSLASLRGSTDQDVGYSTLGMRAASTMQFGGMQMVPHLSAAWQHAFDDVTPGAALAFASTGIGFGIEGVPLAQDSALIDAGLDFALGANTTAGVSYTGQFGDGVTDNGVKGRFTLLF